MKVFRGTHVSPKSIFLINDSQSNIDYLVSKEPEPSVYLIEILGYETV